MLIRFFLFISLLAASSFNVKAMTQLPAPYSDVWPQDLTVKFRRDQRFPFPQCFIDRVSTLDDFSLSSGAQTLDAAIYAFDDFTVQNATLSFDGNKQVIIYADKVTISQSNVNNESAQGQANPLIIMANEVRIQGSNVGALIYAKSSTTTSAFDIDGSSIWGAITTEAQQFKTHGNNIFDFRFPLGQLNGFIDQFCPQPPTNVTATYLDKFDKDNYSYSNSDGTKNWATPWVEFSDGTPTHRWGSVRVEKDTKGNGRLLIHGGNKSIERALNLSTYTQATLSLKYTLDANAPDDLIYLEAYKGGQWIRLHTFLFNESKFGTLSFDLSQYLTYDFKFRFISELGFDRGNSWAADNLYIDYVAVQASGLKSAIDHYRILHPTAGLTCTSDKVAVAACIDSQCQQYVQVPITGKLTKTSASGGTQDVFSFSTSTGIAEKNDFNHPVLEEVTFALADLSPAANDTVKCVTGSISSASTTDCKMTVTESMFELTSPAFTAHSGSWQAVDVVAKRSDPNDPRSCIGSFAGSKKVNLAFNYAQPSVVQNAAELFYAENNSSAPSNSSNRTLANTAQELTLNFSNAESKARFYIEYREAGQLALTISDAEAAVGTGITAGNATATVYPARLRFTLTGNDGASAQDLTANDAVYIADKPFTLAITALNANDDVTQNYIPGDLQLAATMRSPSFSSGATAVQFSYGNSASINIDSSQNGNWLSVQSQIGSSFGAAGYLFNQAKFDDVGSFQLNVKDGSYFGREIFNGSDDTTPTTAGRYTPYYFAIEAIEKGKVKPHDTGYSYFDHKLEFETPPKLTFTAKNYSGADAENYGGSEFKFSSKFDQRKYQETTLLVTPSNPSSAAQECSSSEMATDFDCDLTAGKVTISNEDNYDGKFDVELSEDNFTYTKSPTAVAPHPVKMTLVLSEQDLQDSDNIGYCSDDKRNEEPPTCPSPYESYTLELDADFDIRYARLALENSSGPESEDIRVPAVIQYWDGNAWVRNVDDSESDFAKLTGTVTTLSSPASPLPKFNMVVDADEAIQPGLPPQFFGKKEKFSKGLIIDRYGLVVENENVRAEARLELDNVPDSLNIDWNNDNVIDDKDKVSAIVIFGSFRGNRRIIYKRER